MSQSGKKFIVAASLTAICAGGLFWACGEQATGLEINEGEQVQCLFNTTCEPLAEDLCLAAGGLVLNECPILSSSSTEGGVDKTIVNCLIGSICNQEMAYKCLDFGGTAVSKCPSTQNSSSSVATQSSAANSSSSNAVSQSSATVAQSSSSNGNTGNCVEPNGTVPQNVKNTCATVNGKCYVCNADRSETECSQAWSWNLGNMVTQDYWVTEIPCGSGGNKSSSSAAVKSSSSAAAVSSSSRASSSSAAKSSSSIAAVNPYPALVAGQNGVQNGWTSRYWDACKPSCAWTGKNYYSNRGPTMQCSKDNNKLATGDDMLKSSCDAGGTAYTCWDQAPIIVNENLAYAFTATPGQSEPCGKCWQVQFDGGFHNGDAKPTHQALKGKTLILMSSNIGYDVGAGQFDVMIPGGGVGAFNALSGQIGGNPDLGAQHGGLLTSCIGNNEGQPVATLQKCLKDKCSSTFKNQPALKNGCDFLADWMMAANNPNMLYKEVDCPQELINKYK